VLAVRCCSNGVTGAKYAVIGGSECFEGCGGLLRLAEVGVGGGQGKTGCRRLATKS